MPVISEESRLNEMRRLGLSEPVIRLSAGEIIHDLFRYEEAPYYVYHDAEVPDGPDLIPLWDGSDMVTGVWEKDGRLEFIRFCIESPHEFSVLAKTEQGLLATLFIQYYEFTDGEAGSLREPARLIGFRFLDELVASYESLSHKTSEEHDTFVRKFVAQIDQRHGSM